MPASCSGRTIVRTVLESDDSFEGAFLDLGDEAGSSFESGARSTEIDEELDESVADSCGDVIVSAGLIGSEIEWMGGNGAGSLGGVSRIKGCSIRGFGERGGLIGFSGEVGISGG